MKSKRFIDRIILRFYYFLFKMLTGVRKIPCAPNHPIQYVFPKRNILGVFYDSHSKQEHLVFYIPYEKTPVSSICKRAINFSPSGNEDKFCPVCYEYLLVSSKFKSLAKVVLLAILRKENA